MADKKTNREKLKEITDSIEQGIKELFQSDKYAEYLRTMSKFHSYSVRNTILIHMQRPDATAVAGFNAWKNKFQRHVKKGEKGITILAPTPFKKKIEEKKLDPVTQAPMVDANGNIIMEEEEIEIPLFRPVKVFDVSQTEGKPLPQLSSPLTGDVQNYEIFMEALRRTSPVPIDFKPLEPSMDGFFSSDSQSITLREGMSEVQTICAAVHEITHSLLHNREKERLSAAAGTDQAEKVKPKDRNTEEVEAESVSYAVCQYYGIETGENSLGYIATWSKDRSLPELKASLDTIGKTANQLITDIDRHFKEICKERGVDLTQPEQSASEQPDTPDRFAADLYDFMDRLYREGTLEHPFTQDSKQQFIEEIIMEMENNYWTEIRSPLESVMESTGADEAKSLLARLERIEMENRQPEQAVPEADVPVEPQADVQPEPDAVLYLSESGLYLHIQRTDDGWDYSVYNKNSLRLEDGGQLDAPEMSLSAVTDQIRTMYGMDHIVLHPVPLEMVDTLREAADRAAQAEAEIEEQYPDPLEKLRDHIAAEDDALWDTVLDEYPMPDPAFLPDDLEQSCGYMDGDLLPLSKERAAELLERDLTIYAIVDGGQAEMVFDRDDLNERPPDMMFGVPIEEWEASPDFHQLIADRMNHQEERERAFLDHGGDCFAIYQIKDDDPDRLRFMDMDWLISKGLTVDRANYELAYTGEMACGLGSTALEKLYQKFNTDHPADYHRPSMSVSDILAVKQDGVVSCHYCDSIGFARVPDFIKPENYLKSAEMSMEDDYGMIDGIINNGPKEPTVAQLEQQARSGQPISLMELAAATHREEQEKKQSVREKLKNQPRQKRTAPKKSAERGR